MKPETMRILEEMVRRVVREEMDKHERVSTRNKRYVDVNAPVNPVPRGYVASAGYCQY